jgi:hypothetical protein
MRGMQRKDGGNIQHPTFNLERGMRGDRMHTDENPKDEDRKKSEKRRPKTKGIRESHEFHELNEIARAKT